MGAILREGFEAGSVVATGWFQPGGTSLPTVYQSEGGTLPREDLNGNGGLWFAASPSSSERECSKQLERDVREVWIRFAVVQKLISAGTRPIHFALDDSSGTNQVNLFQPDNGSVVDARRDTTVLGSSGPGAVPEDEANWIILSARVYIDNASGEIEVFKNFDYASPLISVTGVDTQNTADDFARFLRLVLDGSAIDDLAVNDATILVDTTGGTVSVGDTLTANNTGTTCIVGAIVDGSASGQARLQVYFVRVNGTDAWNDPDTDPWDTDTQLSNGTGWTANVLAPKTTFKDDNSGPLRDGFIYAAQPSADVGGDIQLARAGVDTGANYSQVAAIPADDPTALQSSVETTTPGERDIYEMENTSAAGFGGGEINSVLSVTVSAFWQRDGSGLNNGYLVVENGGVEYDGPGYALTVSADGNARILNTAPDGSLIGASWDEATVNSLRIGIKFTG